MRGRRGELINEASIPKKKIIAAMRWNKRCEKSVFQWPLFRQVHTSQAKRPSDSKESAEGKQEPRAAMSTVAMAAATKKKNRWAEEEDEEDVLPVSHPLAFLLLLLFLFVFQVWTWFRSV